MDSKRVWGAAIFPIGHPEVFGGMWDSDQLHWTRAAAIAEIESQVIKMGLLPLEWTSGAGDLMVGRTHHPSNKHLEFAVLVRSARMPQGEPQGEPPRELSSNPPPADR
jgi:hypothetical protein